jgi:orotate phosphoribosyltransferase
MSAQEQQEALALLKKAGAYLEGHFLLTSGLHSPAYVEKFELLQYPRYCDQFCKFIADKFSDRHFTVVLGPAIGGIIMAYGVARARGGEVRGIFMEREEGKLTLRRGFHIKPDDEILLVEDVVTTGSSVFEVWDALGEDSKKVVGLGYLIDRSGGKVQFPVKSEAVLSLDLPTYKPEACPLCAKGQPLTKRGSRKLA